ncbi:MAG: hypothetical protein OXE53_01175, partial [Deltaproteobacteria bacterium]|nr:hypothetical protein [Deltaproteobacteria bacterium]
AVDEAIAALTAADQAEAMSTAAYTAAAAALSAAQTAVANADADTLADASAALAAALADAATAAADLGVKTQAVTDATAALEAARTTLASVDPTHVSLQAATAALERAQTEANNQAEAIKALQKQIADLQKAEQDRMDAANRMAEEERMKEMTATGKAIYGALGAAPLGKLDADTDPILTSTSLTLAASTAVTDLTIPPMDAGDPASTLGGWSGMNYVEDDTSTKQSDRALVYTNLSLPKPVAWADSEYGDTAPTFGDTADARAKSSRFPSSIGTRTYSEVGDPQVQLPGTYDGASGLYLCTGACTVTYTSAGPTFSTGWSFNPADNAMVQPADDAYLYFGWWVQTNDGDPTHASAFFGVVGTDGDAATAGAADTLSGTATYGGKAVGKYAINNVLAGNAEGGHFTADATLTAKFTSGADGDTITGTINNFMAGGEAKAWSVSLTEGTIASGGDFGVGGMTEWSIGGNKAAKAGSYSGQLYNATDDSDEVPAQALGSFHAEYSGLGRMVGAFGADKQ